MVCQLPVATISVQTGCCHPITVMDSFKVVIFAAMTKQVRPRVCNSKSVQLPYGSLYWPSDRMAWAISSEYCISSENTAVKRRTFTTA